MKTKQYVVGFMIDPTIQSVLLIKKNKPKWQCGLLNGLGGKVEAGESFVDAMVREFYEESGMETQPALWKPICFMTDKKCSFEVQFFKASGLLGLGLKSPTDEQVIVVPIKSIPDRGDVVDDVKWLLPLAVHAKSDVLIVYE